MSRKPEINEPFYASVDYGYKPMEWATVMRRLAKLKIDMRRLSGSTNRGTTVSP
jgi:hypothetical protein